MFNLFKNKKKYIKEFIDETIFSSKPTKKRRKNILKDLCVSNDFVSIEKKKHYYPHIKSLYEEFENFFEDMLESDVFGIGDIASGTVNNPVIRSGGTDGISLKAENKTVIKHKEIDFVRIANKIKAYMVNFLNSIDDKELNNYYTLKKMGLDKNEFCYKMDNLQKKASICDEYLKLDECIHENEKNNNLVVLPKIFLKSLCEKYGLIDSTIDQFTSEIPQDRIVDLSYYESLPEYIKYVLEKDNGNYIFDEYKDMSLSDLDNILKKRDNKNIFKKDGLILTELLGRNVALRLYKKRELKVITDVTNLNYNQDDEQGITIFYLDFSDNIIILTSWIIDKKEVLSYDEYKKLAEEKSGVLSIDDLPETDVNNTVEGGEEERVKLEPEYIKDENNLSDR
jgi:hypothetical protein